MMNKPAGYVCKTVSDRNPPVYNLLPQEILYIPELGKLHTIGRLDLDTEGLLIFTTDGKLSHYLTLPENHVPKKYYVELSPAVSEEKQVQITEDFQKGIFLPEEKKGKAFTTKPARLQWISHSSCDIWISEGKFHQIKRMFSAEGHSVTFLKRTEMGELKLDSALIPGKYRELLPQELILLRSYIDSKIRPC